MAKSSSAAEPGPLAALPPELYALLDGPSIMYVGTRNAAMEPLSTLAFGLEVAGGDRELTLFVPAVLSPSVVANLRDNGQMAVELVRPSDHRALQIKGVWVGERRTTDDDRAFLTRYHGLLLQEMRSVGIPRSKWDRLVWWPAVALRMEVREVFVQTPGPGAGRRCEPGAARETDRPGRS